MSQFVTVPTVGESISEVVISSWLKKDGSFVEQDEVICEIESDKASVELTASAAGVLKIISNEGDTVAIGAKIGEIDESKKASSAPKPQIQEIQTQVNQSTEKVASASPAAAKILREKGIAEESIAGTGKDGRITKEDAQEAQVKKVELKEVVSTKVGEREIKREKMSTLRKTIAKKLVIAKSETAMLTTFNEVDMFEVMNLRKKYKDQFKEVHQVNLGFMSFFTKAVCESLKKFPAVNSQIDKEEIVSPSYADIGVAVSTPKGLVVPVLRSAEKMSLAEIEKEILSLATQARDGKLSIAQMSGGTFTITNGGVFGSMLSTPIINYPQSAILGMHNIVERPHVVNGEIKIRPIMFLALSYDHRLIDGRESVGFLKSVKDLLEDPSRLLLGL